MARGRRRASDPLRCRDCGTGEPAAFKTPLSLVCAACKRTRKSAGGKRYHAANRETDNARGKVWYRAHAAEILDRIRDGEREKARRVRRENPRIPRAASRRWYWKDPARAARMSRAWRKKNPEACRSNERKRRAMEAGVVRTLTAAEWREVIFCFGGACAYCLRTDRKITQDHMTPISRGGAHSKDNVVPACGSCNSRKHRRSIFAMLG